MSSTSRCIAPSRDVAKSWNRQIRLPWIDGDIPYSGAKEDFDLFSPYLADGAIVAFHDMLHGFEGPIRVYVEDILRCNCFGPPRFFTRFPGRNIVPQDGPRFRAVREQLAATRPNWVPFGTEGRQAKGLGKLRFHCAGRSAAHSIVAAEGKANIVLQLR